MFPDTPSIRLYDPLGDLLGAGDGHFTYTFDDAVKLAGHACPTVAGAFLMAKKALECLFPGETPQRGDIRIRVGGASDEGVNGPITQVFTLVTGAATANGFKGLGGGGWFGRKDLLYFQEDWSASHPFTFERIFDQRVVQLDYSPAAFPASPVIGQLLPKILAGQGSAEERTLFRNAWRQRVLDILADNGANTVKHVG